MPRESRSRGPSPEVQAGPGEATSPTGVRSVSLSPAQSFCLVLGLALGLVAFCLLDIVSQNRSLEWSFLGAGSALIAWNAVVCGWAHHRGRTLTLDVVLRKHHYLQACAQGAFFLYWGWYWPPVYESAFLLAAQLVFGYVFDMLLCWSRRDTYQLGFGPFPIVFSINLFLWFADEWFYLQFLLIALGFAVKDLVRWNKEGRSAHIFNPSSFPLAVVSLGLIVTGTSDITWGRDIAISQFFPPHVYLVLFLIALPGQYFFGVVSMTMSAVVTTYLFGLLYFAVTGVYFFYDSYIPIAVFLGMHLLFTDPSTSPRTELGRIMFGVLYGLSTVALYALLSRAGVPTFYDKLLQIPILNLSIVLIDRAARSTALRNFDPGVFGRSLPTRHRNLAHIAVWVVAFALISAAQGVGDRHPGQWLPFWQQACAEGRPRACNYLVARQSSHCNNGSGWSCNEVGILLRTVLRAAGDERGLDPREAAGAFERGCELEFVSACGNLVGMLDGNVTFGRAPPTLRDYPIILRGSKGVITARDPAALYARACDQGWPDTCDRSGVEPAAAQESLR